MKTTRFFLPTTLAVVLSALFAGCQGKSYSRQSELTVDALDACEVVLWDLLDETTQSLQPQTYYLELLGEDPRDEFVQRFCKKHDNVRKVSEIKYNLDEPEKVAGVKLFVTKVSQLDENTFLIRAGHWISSEAAGGQDYTVQRRRYGGKWVIVGGGMHWIS